METATELIKNVKHLKEAVTARVDKVKEAVKESQANRHKQTAQQNQT
ncbi:hypothetical protein LCGC14_1614610 [marine sediment metagenome]|uniref:Uncharacterized protein n=1 Tax=marine sediment metagenome TaxID=412755 RepID=A0A0F9I786_9ZZZZ